MARIRGDRHVQRERDGGAAAERGAGAGQRPLGTAARTPRGACAQVVQSDGALDLSEVLEKYGLVGAADGFYFHAEPLGGYYCIYSARPGQPGIVPDCPGITGTLTRHAAQLVHAGVDYVVLDSTNLGNPSREADAIQSRPTEVVFEQWAALRAAGVPTPAVTVWQVRPRRGACEREATRMRAPPPPPPLPPLLPAVAGGVEWHDSVSAAASAVQQLLVPGPAR